MLDAPLISIFSLGLLGSAIQSVISPFFPGEAKDKGVSSTVIGLIFGIQPIVASICSPIFGMILFKVGRKRVLLISAFMLVRITQACSSFSFALVPNFNKDAFIAVGFLSRIFQGVGGSGCAISIVAIISNNYRDNMEKLFGIQQTLSGVAMIIGPVIGLVLFKIGGFSCIFYVLSAIFTGCLIFLSYYLPPDKENLITKEKISWSVLLRVKTIPIDCILIACAFGGLGAIEPTLGNFLSKEFDIDSSMTALVFIVPTVAYPVSVFVSNKYFSHVGSKAKMSTGLFIIGVSMFILGPVGFTKIPSSILITILGISGIGAGLGLSMVPALPDMVNFATEQLPHIESFMISDRVSSLINLFMYIGKGVFAPIAGVLTDEYNFKNAMGMIGVVILLYAVYFRMTSIKMRSIKSLKSSTLLRENEMKEAKSSFYLLEEDEV